MVQGAGLDLTAPPENDRGPGRGGEHRGGAFSGVRVLDLSQFLSGPRATQLLADLGADVIKIEPPQGETMRLLTMMIPGVERTLSIIHRNKKGITLNLKSEKGRGIFKQLVAVSDVVVENFTPGTMEKLGLSYDVLSKIQPRLIYLAISGFGRSGPLKDYPAFDLIAQAAGGIMAALEQESKPPKVMFGDLVSGAFGALGVAAALFARQQTGAGQFIDLSMQDVMYIHNYRALSRRATEGLRETIDSFIGKTTVDQLLTDESRRMPFWNSYATQDGHVALVALTDDQWKGLVAAVDDPELAGDAYSNLIQRLRNWKRGAEIVARWCEGQTTAETVRVLRSQGVPCTPVMGFDQVNADEQLRQRSMLEEITHPRLGSVKIPGNPLKLEQTPPRLDRPHPDLGQDTADVLSSLLNLTPSDLESLRREGAI
ncbi:MAG: CoA transferase [Nitrospirae bacterium]|nr:CoA transferase [Nitrospirota bacterium]